MKSVWAFVDPTSQNVASKIKTSYDKFVYIESGKAFGAYFKTLFHENSISLSTKKH